MATVLAQSSAHPVVQGTGSIGPFPVPAGSPGALLVIERAGLPALAPLLSVMCWWSFDGGQTFQPLAGAGIDGGDIPARGGGTLAQSTVSFLWTAVPTHIRIDVDSQVAFSASFSVTAL